MKVYIISMTMISSQLGAGLGGMGYSRRPYKKTIPYCKFVRG